MTIPALLATGASLALFTGLFMSDAWAQYYLGGQAGWTGLPYQTDTIDSQAAIPVRFNAGYNLGVRTGYTQEDVIAVARCFTGWTVRDPINNPVFVFASFMHDFGEKTVLGQLLPHSFGLAAFDTGSGLQVALRMKGERKKCNGCCEDDP